MMDVNISNFETEVVAASASVPVLIDFWAPWCGPCKTIGPILEKLETEYGGRFKLVKINSDDEQQLSAAFGIRSIPTCILMMNGQPVDGFMGALPQGQVKAFLDKHLPPIQEEPAPQEPDEQPASEEDRLAALLAAVEKAPEDDNVRFECMQALLLSGDVKTAIRVFQSVENKAAHVRRFESIQLLLDALKIGSSYGGLQKAKAEFEAKVASNKRDFAARFGYAQALVAAAQYTPAMDELLEILMRDKLWDKEAGQEGKARKLYIAVLDLIDPPKPKLAEGQIPPEDPTVVSYRRRLSSVVLS